MNSPVQDFINERIERVANNRKNEKLLAAAKSFNTESNKALYSYNFSWMGRPIIQYPQDMVAMQEIIWDIKPDLVIETGIAHGGSLIFYASIMELVGKGRVLGIDIDIREHNRKEIEAHPMYKRIKMIQGSSVSPEVLEQVKEEVKGCNTILVCLDSNHTHEHVLHELNLYAPFVTRDSYLVVFDTIVEYLPDDYLPGRKRPWGMGNNPHTSIISFLERNDSFVVDSAIDNKLLISVAPGGYLRRVK